MLLGLRKGLEHSGIFQLEPELPTCHRGPHGRRADEDRGFVGHPDLSAAVRQYRAASKRWLVVRDFDKWLW